MTGVKNCSVNEIIEVFKTIGTTLRKCQDKADVFHATASRVVSPTDITVSSVTPHTLAGSHAAQGLLMTSFGHMSHLVSTLEVGSNREFSGLKLKLFLFRLVCG